MRITYLSAITASFLLLSNQVAIAENDINKYTITQKACPKSKFGKIENNKICLKDGTLYRWAIKKTLVPTNTSSIPLNSNTTTSLNPVKPQLDDANNIFIINTNIKNNAIAEINKKLNSQTIQKLNANYYIAPTISKELENNLKNELNISSTFWSTIFTSSNINIVIWDSYSKDWADEVYDKLKNNMWNQGFKISSTAPEIQFCNNAYSSNFYDNNGPRYIIISCDRDIYFERTKFKMSHEYTHLVQDYLGLLQDNSPVWVIEGGAHFYGQYIGFNKNYNLIKNDRKNLINNYYYNGQKDFSSIDDFIINSTPTEFSLYMKKLEKRMPSNSNLQASYLIGSIASEYLVGKYGEDKLLQFWKEFKSSSSIDYNFKKIYNYNLDDFYIDLQKYIIFSLKDN